MANTRSQIVFGPGYATWNSGNFRFNDGGLVAEFMKDSKPISSDEFSRIDGKVVNKWVKVTAQLWSGWENIALLFASTFLTPVRGASLFGASDLPLVANGRNGDRLTLHNLRWINIPQLFLGVNGDLFGGALEGMALIRDTFSPEDANAYHTWATGQSYAAPAFSRSNHKAPRMSAAWTGISGFDAFSAKGGWKVSIKPTFLGDDMGWDDGRGMVDKYIDTCEIEASADPLGPTEAQVQAAFGFGSALGSLESANAADLTITGGGISVALASMYLAKHAASFNVKSTRVGELTWNNVVPFTTGAPVARAVVS